MLRRAKKLNVACDFAKRATSLTLKFGSLVRFCREILDTSATPWFRYQFPSLKVSSRFYQKSAELFRSKLDSSLCCPSGLGGENKISE